MKLTKIFKLSPLSLLVLAACGGGGSDSPTIVEDPPVQEDPVVNPPAEVTGLTTPEIISIVTDSADGTPGMQKTAAANAFDDAGTDYTTDKTRAYVWDESMGPMQMVNQILCYVGQTRADQLVNQTYTALVDTARCERDEEDSDDMGQSSGNAETEYQLWTIESTRETNDSPQRVRIWVPSEDSDSDDPMDQQSILVDVTIASSPSDELPFGDFNMSWKGVVDMNGNEMSTMQGTIQTVENQDGKLQFMFYNGSDMPGMDFSFSEAANVILDDADGTSGIGKTATHRADPFFEFHSEFSVAYDPSRFLRGKDENEDGLPDAQLCNDRLNMDENVWRYNLYHQDSGDRVEMNSGFPFTAEVAGDQLDGYISYWGMWLPGDVDRSSIQTITRHDYSGEGNNAVYDVIHTPGKLIKRSKSTIPLADLDGTHFNYWDNGEYLVEYTTDAELNDGRIAGDAGFFKIAEISFNEGERQVTPIDPIFIDSDFMHFWSESLGGSIAYDSFADPLNIVAFQEEFISGTDGSLFGSATVAQLDCYNDCLKAGITAEQLAGIGESPYYPNSEDPTIPAVTYSFSASDLTLRDPEGNAVAMLDGENAADMWGMHSGAMVLAGTVLDNPWDTYNQEVSFVWETGPNDWNKMTFIREQGAAEFVQFDRPMQFLYTHSNDNDRNSADSQYAGQSYLLEYGGPGDLWGFPELENDQRHMRAFSLADGSALSNQSGDYVVKATELEKRMKALAVEACTTGDNAMTLNDALSIELPTSADVAPINFGLSDKPVVTDSPRVVGGEIVSD